jgi:hypothetical protein
MAHPTALEDCRFVCVDFGEAGLLVAVETAALKHESSTSIEHVAGCALDSRYRRVLTERQEAGRRFGADEDLYFFFAALPRQSHGMQSRRSRQGRVENVWKRLFRWDRRAVK